MNRRTFAKSAAAFAITPLLARSSLFGQFAPSNRIRIAAIGLGNQSQIVNLNGFAQLPEVDIVACADPYLSKRQAFQQSLQDITGKRGCEGTSDYRNILERSDIDAVVVCAPDHWHVKLAADIARSGKALYLEKPLSLCLDWSEQLRSIYEQHPVPFQFGTQQRSERQFQQAVSLVRNGYIGELRHIEVWCPDLQEYYKRAAVKAPFGSTEITPVPDGFDYDLWTGPAPVHPHQPGLIDRWYQSNDHSLGYIANWGVHMLDIAQWGANMDENGPVEYEGIGTITPPFGIYNNIQDWDIHARYANGVTLRFMSYTLAESVVMKYHYAFHTHGTVFHGTEGWIGVDRMAMYSHNRNALRKVEFSPSEPLVGKINRQGQLQHPPANHQADFIQSLVSGSKPLCPFNTALSSDTIGVLSDLCIRSKQSVNWDPLNRKLLNPTERQSQLLGREMRTPYKLS